MKSRVLAPLIGLAAVALLGIGWTVFASATPAQQLANYHNDRWHFSINVPSNMTVDDVENVGAEEQIIQFSDASADHVFEISAAPTHKWMSLSAKKEHRTIPTTSRRPSGL